MHSMAAFVPWSSTSRSAEVRPLAVQPIDVLRDDHCELARPLEIRDRGVHGIRLRIPERRPGLACWSQYSMRAASEFMKSWK